jgi:hypothetical protein
MDSNGIGGRAGPAKTLTKSLGKTTSLLVR